MFQMQCTNDVTERALGMANSVHTLSSAPKFFDGKTNLMQIICDFRQPTLQLGQSCPRNFDTATKTFKILIGNEFCTVSQVYCIKSKMTRNNVCLYAFAKYYLSYSSSDCLLWRQCATFVNANCYQLNTLIN